MSGQAARKHEQPETDRRLLAEQLGSGIADWLPRSQQLVLGWLMVCRPAEQTQSEIRAALSLSLGGVSTAPRMLEQNRLAERLPPTAGRATRYVFAEGGWARALQLSVDKMASTAAFARDAAARVGAEGDERVQRNIEELVRYFEAAIEAIGPVAARLRDSG